MTLDHSKWSVSPRGHLTWQGRLIYSSQLNIVLLDDHPIFSEAVKERCIIPFFPQAKFFEFQRGDEAFRFLKKSMDEDLPIDLLITDYNHPGLCGEMLVMNIRAYEDRIRRGSRIPILLLTMMGPEQIKPFREYPLFTIDSYLCKNASSDMIIDALEELLYRKRKWLVECFVAGFQYYEGNKLLPLMRRGTRLLLQREPNNTHDANAVAVYLKDRKIGYLPAGRNRLIAALMDAGKSFEAEVTEINPDAGDWGKVKVGI